MSFDTYENFKSEIEDWIDRPDLSAKVDSFIDLAEATIRRRCKGLEREVRAQATMLAGSRFLALPTDYRGMKNLSIAPSTGGYLMQVTADHMDRLVEKYLSGAFGNRTKPEFFAVHGNEIEVFPLPREDTAFEMTYIPKLTAIEAGVTNVIFDEHPDIYLYATLVEASPYMVEDTRVQLFKGLLDDRIREYNEEAEQMKFGNAPLTMRPTIELTRLG